MGIDVVYLLDVVGVGGVVVPLCLLLLGGVHHEGSLYGMGVAGAGRAAGVV